ncbi:MAG: DUF4912 domain-containing protein [Nitrospirae bacterium]|nr:DUF4912 domain-containing protein [Nitrospirota bacterium]
MTKKEIAEKDIKELRSLAKEAGISAKKGWTKNDFAEAISKKSSKPSEKKKAKVASAKKKAVVPSKKVKPKAKKEEKKSKPSKSAALKKTAIERKTPAQKKKAPPEKSKAEISKKPAVKKINKKSLAKQDENIVMVMTVSPERIYAYWEISEESFAKHEGDLNLKVIDIKSDESFLVPISDRVDEHFIAVKPGGFYVVEVGVVAKNGLFSPIESSPRPHLPGHFSEPMESSSDSGHKRRVAKITADGSIVFFEAEKDLPAFDFPDETQFFCSY